MNDIDHVGYSTVSARIELDVLEEFSTFCKALGTTKSSYMRTLILREIAGDSDRKIADPISAMTLGVVVSQRLLAAIPPDILDQAVGRLRQESMRATSKKGEASS